jgi:hypothetical protein
MITNVFVKKPRSNEITAMEAAKNDRNMENAAQIPQNSQFNHDHHRIRYKRAYFMQITFALFVFTLISVQFHNDKLQLQVLKVTDNCAALQNSTREEFLTETGRLLSDSEDQILNPNITIQYLNREECEHYKNSTNLFDVFTVRNGGGIQEDADDVNLNYSSIYLCIDDVSKNFILNETFLRNMLLNSYFSVNENLTFNPELTVISKVNFLVYLH